MRSTIWQPKELGLDKEEMKVSRVVDLLSFPLFPLTSSLADHLSLSPLTPENHRRLLGEG